MDEGIVEGSEDASDTEDEFTCGEGQLLHMKHDKHSMQLPSRT